MRPYYFYLWYDGKLTARSPELHKKGLECLIKKSWQVNLDDDTTLDQMLREAHTLGAKLTESECKRIGVEYA